MVVVVKKGERKGRRENMQGCRRIGMVDDREKHYKGEREGREK